MEKRNYTTTSGDKSINIEFNNMAQQANGSVIAKMGETTILVTATSGQNDRFELDYFPLSVDYEEKFYAAGKIYGSRFVRREGRASENAILVGRLIDRTLRPLFNSHLRREVQIIVTCLSLDENNDPDILGILGASVALSISNIPWDGPVAAVRIGYTAAGEFIVNPTFSERENLVLDMVVSGNRNKVNMLEGGARECSEEIIGRALEIAQEEINKLIDFQEDLIKKEAKPKMILPLAELPVEKSAIIKKFLNDKLESAIFNYDGNRRLNHEQLKTVEDSLFAYLIEEEKWSGDDLKLVDIYIEEEINNLVHKKAIEEEKRPDGRKLTEIRPIEVSLDILPRAHGSALFMRGETHVLSVITLGAPGDELTIQGMEITGTKKFIHHYNFPPYCSGETGPMRGPGRREIGHGALAEKGVFPMIPTAEIFPYTIRAVSEVLSSNGSTSMAATCATSLALMAAGVPIKELVGGVACGMMSDATGKYKLLTDIQGPEDHHGDMDFKVSGTRNGVNAIQMDVKVNGVSIEILKEAFANSHRARLEVLDTMYQVITEPRKELSPLAPRIYTLHISPEVIGSLIGPGGKNINQIIKETETTIDIEEDGTIYVTAVDKEGADKAILMINNSTKTYSEGDIVEGKVSQIKDFGAIVDLDANHDGLLHISEMAPWHVNNVTDVVKLGDIIKVRVKKVENGKLSLSMKEFNTMPEPENNASAPSSYMARPHRDFGGNGSRPPRRNY
jgi:polyribonucleotide nucleotidyltransferase